MAWLRIDDTEPTDEQFVWGYTGGAERLPVKLWQPLEWPDMPWQDLAQ